MDPTKFDPLKDQYLRIEPVGPDKQEKDIQLNDVHLLSSDLFNYIALTLLQEPIEDFAPAKEEGQKNKQRLLERFSLLLEQLKEKDLSQNLEFLTSLALTYQHLLDDWSEHPTDTENADYLFFMFTQKLNTYPNDKDMSLHKYLAKTRAVEWLPFPFMDILHTLHREAVTSPDHCHLSLWISQLTSIYKAL